MLRPEDQEVSHTVFTGKEKKQARLSGLVSWTKPSHSEHRFLEGLNAEGSVGSNAPSLSCLLPSLAPAVTILTLNYYFLFPTPWSRGFCPTLMSVLRKFHSPVVWVLENTVSSS